MPQKVSEKEINNLRKKTCYGVSKLQFTKKIKTALQNDNGTYGGYSKNKEK